jgi:FkbM family methyltransferase
VRAEVEVRANTTDQIVIDEVWSENVYRLEPHMLTGGTVVDLGANIGAFTLRVLATNPAEKVVAVEPVGASYKQLLVNVERNGWSSRLCASNCAVGAVGVQSCKIDGDDAEAFTVWEPGDTPVQPLEAFLSGEVDVLKIDVEGAEWAFLSQSWELFDRVRWLTMEWHKCSLARLGDLTSRLLMTHVVEVLGHPDQGGMLWAHRYDV